MDLEKLRSKQELYNNDNLPSCNTECPIHVDVKEFIREIKKGNFEDAYKILKRRIPFTNIIALICDHPCEKACITNVDDKAISIHELEKAAVMYGSKANIKTLPIPKINKNIAVIGGGISGITCAADLNQKGYHVVFFEKENQIGGKLLSISEKLIDSKLIEEEIVKLEELGIELKLRQEITPEKLEKLMNEYDAVFIATGIWKETFGFNGITLQTEKKKVFVGGHIVTWCNSIIQSVQTGRSAAISIDRFVQKKSLTALRENEESYKSRFLVDFENKSILPRVEPASRTFTEEEAINEANRCVQCECHKCVKTSIYLQKDKLNPKSYIRTIRKV